MRQYEITFIIDPVLPGDEAQTAAKAYEKLITDEGCSIINVDNMGLKQLAYPINKKNSGVYKCIEFQTETGAVIPKVELAMKRDERIMRFLTVKLDKYGVKYNEDKRNGLIGKAKKSKDDEGTKKEEKPAYRIAKDDLSLMEGIDPKAAKLLTTAGINTYAKLSKASPVELKDILSKGGPSFQGLDTTTWPQQGALASEGKWSELNALKDKIANGNSEEE